MNNENLGPAERIIQMILGYNDHMVHNRPGMVKPDARAQVGVVWSPVTWVQEGANRVVYSLTKVGKKQTKTKVGLLQPNGKIHGERGQVIGEYRRPGLFPEVAIWMYKQVAEVWKLDNEFAAHWASYAFKQEHRDLKTVLAAFMLVQSRKGDPVRSADGKVEFYYEDYRAIGEAMLLLTKDPKDAKDPKVKDDFSPKLLMRIHDLLCLPAIAEINRELGFGISARSATLGRWEKAVHKWLRFREENPKMLGGLVKNGFRTTVIDLAKVSCYKPESPKFFEALRWKQEQSKLGHRQMLIGEAVKAAESWEDLTEEQICQKIVKDKVGYKRLVSLVPTRLGMTRAIMAAAIEAGSLSDKDLIIAAPTLEDLGLLKVQEIRDRWDRAVRNAEDMRAANVAKRMKTQEAKEKLEEAADNALKKAVEEVTKGLRIYFIVDISGSMTTAIPTAKRYIAQFLQGFPQDKLHVSVFNTQGREVKIPHASAAGIENAFRGIQAGGGTEYGAGVRALQGYKPSEDEDTLFIFVGDEQANVFDEYVRASGLRPMAFGLVKVSGGPGDQAVRGTAIRLGIPCFQIDEAIFADPYAIPRTVRALVAATPVGHTAVNVAAPRVSLAEMIAKTELLKKPAWAA